MSNGGGTSYVAIPEGRDSIWGVDLDRYQGAGVLL
jgi:hypothetical protein